MAPRKLVFVFNRFYSMLLADLHAMGVPEVSAALPMVAPKKSDAFFQRFSEAHRPFHAGYVGGSRVTDDPEFRKVQVVEGVSVSTLLSLGMSEGGLQAMESYLHIMYLCVLISQTCGDAQRDATIEHVLGIMKAVEEGSEDADELIADVVNADMRAILCKIRDGMSRPPHPADDKENLPPATDRENARPADNKNLPPAAAEEEGLDDDCLNAIRDSSLGKLAQEISSQIDLSDLNIGEPADVMKLFSDQSGGRVIGNIMEAVGSTIQAKLADGELKQDELMRDAINVMGSLGAAKGPQGEMIKNMLGAFGGDPSGGKLF